MESWKVVWRKAIGPLATTEGLEHLKEMLIRDDPKLIQGATSQPPPLMCVQDWPCEGCCGLSMLLPDAVNGETTVGAVEEFFARMCFEIDQRLGEPAGCRHFLNWYDETPRSEMRPELLTEIERSLELRLGKAG